MNLLRMHLRTRPGADFARQGPALNPSPQPGSAVRIKQRHATRCAPAVTVSALKTGYAGTAGTEAEEAHRQRLWKAAIKLPIYSVGYIPVMVASAAMYLETGYAPLEALPGFALVAVLVIAWLNLSNDVYDPDTGVDATKPESVVNLTGSRSKVEVLANTCLAAVAALMTALTSGSGDTRPAALLALAIVCGYLYQGPPFRLSYKGLGEPLCFMATGSATMAFYLAMTNTTTLTTTAAAATGLGDWAPPCMWASSALMGVTTTLILLTSHFHQIEGDRQAGKMSPLVRLGLDRGLAVLTGCVGAAYALAVLGAGAGALPWTVVPALSLSVPAARDMVGYGREHLGVPPKLALLKRFACSWHIAYGGCLALGLVAARLMGVEGE